MVQQPPSFSVKFIELVDSVLAYSSPWDERLQALSATVANRCFRYKRPRDVLVAAQYLLDASEFLLRDENLRLPAKRPLLLAIVLNTLRRREFDLELLGFGGASVGGGGASSSDALPVVSHEPTCSGEQLAVAWRYRAVLIASLDVAVRILEQRPRGGGSSRSGAARRGRGSGAQRDASMGRRPRSVELEEGFAVQVVALAFFRLPKLRAHIVAALARSAAASEQRVLGPRAGALHMVAASMTKEDGGVTLIAVEARGEGKVVASVTSAPASASAPASSPGAPLRTRVRGLLREVERKLLVSDEARSDHGGATFIAENPSLFLWSWFHREAATAVGGGAWNNAAQPRSAFETRQRELKQEQERRIDSLATAAAPLAATAGAGTGDADAGAGRERTRAVRAAACRPWILRLVDEHDLFFEFAASVNDHVWAQARGTIRWGMVQGYLPIMRFFVGAYTRMAEWRCPSLRRALEEHAAAFGFEAAPRWTPLEIRSVLRCSATMMRNAHLLDLLIQIAFSTTNANLLPDIERCFNQLTLWFPTASEAHAESQRRKGQGGELMLPVTRGVRRAATQACREAEERQVASKSVSRRAKQKTSSSSSSSSSSSPDAIAGVLSPGPRRRSVGGARSSEGSAAEGGGSKPRMLVSDRWQLSSSGDERNPGRIGKASEAAADEFRFQEGLSFVPGQTSLPPSFDFVFFLDCLSGLLMHDHFQIVLKALSFIYNLHRVFHGSLRTALTQKVLLSPKLFFRLFLHWMPECRRYFMHILVYKAFRTPRTLLPSKTDEQLLSAVKDGAGAALEALLFGSPKHLEKQTISLYDRLFRRKLVREQEERTRRVATIDASMENETQARDLVLMSRLDSLVTMVIQHHVDPSGAGFPTAPALFHSKLRPYIQCALEEYTELLCNYYESIGKLSVEERTSGDWQELSVRISPMLDFTFIHLR